MGEAQKKRSPPPCGSRTWTKEELAYIEESWGKCSIPSIAKKLNRTTNAIKNKAVELRLGAVLMSGDYITLNQLMKAVNAGRNTQAYHLESWVKKRGLPVHTKKVDKCSFRVVFIDEFWEWAEKNRAFIDFTKFEPFALGEEPDWVAEQRRVDFVAFPLQRKDAWTPTEDAKLLLYLKQQRYGYKELSEMLHRSCGAIQRRCNDLGIKYRPVKAGTNNVWSETDFETLADGIRSGESYALIGNKIGKSEKAVRGKVYCSYFTENADKVRAMLGSGKWGDGAPLPSVRQAATISGYSADTKKVLTYLAGLLRYRMNQLGYDPYWQRFMCMNWDDFDGCTVGGTDCDSCTAFKRIREQYCARCGGTFYERKENRFCEKCRIQRKKQAQKKWSILSQRRNRT